MLNGLYVQIESVRLERIEIDRMTMTDDVSDRLLHRALILIDGHGTFELLYTN